MSIFSLLTRGTNLQRTRNSRFVQEQKIPSAGPDYISQSDWTHDPQHIQSERRGTKRKRDSTVDRICVQVPEQLDFFAGTTKKQQHGPSVEEQSTADASTQQSTTEQGVANNIGDVADLDEGSCRRILKQNKLKISLIDEGDTLPRSSKKASKVRKSIQDNDKTPKRLVQLILRPLVSFGELRSRYRISKRLAENLQSQGFTHPTEVQLGSIPILLGSDKDRGLPPGPEYNPERQTDVDLMTVAPTGSGKTLAFLVHLLHHLIEDRNTGKVDLSEKDARVQALIITPTQELADQIVNEGRKLAIGTGVSVSNLRKGTCLHPELQNTRDHLEEPGNTVNGDEEHANDPRKQRTLVKSSILVSTHALLLSTICPPGSTDPLPIPSIRYLVFDEADLLLSHPWQPITLKTWSALSFPHLQTSLWSATIGSSIETLTRDFISTRRRSANISHYPHHLIRLIVGLKDTAVPNVTHTLTYAATEQGKLLALRQLLNPSHTSTTDPSTSVLRPPFLIFTQTIPRAVALHAEIKYDIPFEAGGSSRIAVLHSDLSSPLRAEIMAGFRKGEIWVLITTDLLSRGVDFRGLNAVVNYDIPTTSASYVHRAGRTGRQGREGGVVVTLYTKEDIPYVKNIANVIAAAEKAKAEANAAVKSEVGIPNLITATARSKQTTPGEGRSSQKWASGIDQWLLDALPNVSKQTKKQLKRNGVESRRMGFDAREGRKARISTKSGYERRMEQKRGKGGKFGEGRGDGRRRGEGKMEGGVDGGGGGESGKWDGFDD